MKVWRHKVSNQIIRREARLLRRNLEVELLVRQTYTDLHLNTSNLCSLEMQFTAVASQMWGYLWRSNHNPLHNAYFSFQCYQI